MNEMRKVIEQARGEFRSRLETILQEGGILKEVYVRFLSMQYHLTKGVQRHFYLVASHSDMASRQSLRSFLVKFGNEEEHHYEIARMDLEAMGEKPLPPSQSYQAWNSYFMATLWDKPFVRLGATCILENIAAGSNDVVTKLLTEAPYLNGKNTRFFVIHQHGPNLPHGDQILHALDEARLEPQHWKDVLEGAEMASQLYLKMVDWAMSGKS